MKCPNCGAEISKDTKFCSNCGNAIEFSKQKDSNNNSNDSISNIMNIFSSKPKLIVAVVIVLVIIMALMFMGGGSNQGYSKDGGFVQEVFGMSFHIPEGFKETYHSGPFSSGETVDFGSGDYDDLEIVVSPKYNVDLNSKHVTAKMQKTIHGKSGVVAFYDSNRVSFYYDDGGYTIKLNTNSPDYEELFDSVIV